MHQIVYNILNNELAQYRLNCPENITDLVFLVIENSYMTAYEAAVAYKGRDEINKFIGKNVREIWNLKNLGRCNSPRSRLITSYEKHSN